MKKDSFVKDALVLTAITLVSGLLLGAAYGITKQKIEDTNNAATNASYKEVMGDAAEFAAGDLQTMVDQANSEGLLASDHNGADIISAAEAKDGSGNTIGYVIKAECAGYGGEDVVVVGVSTADDIKVTGISFPETLPETAGLGQRAKEPEFYEQFAGKGMNLSVKKGGGAGEDEIDAISGATITSTAVTNAVNASTDFVQNYLLK